MKIAMTSVFVHNPIEAFKFYTEVLGFTERLFIPEALLAIVVSPEDPHGTGLLLEPNDNPIAKTYQTALHEAGFPVIVFGVEDIYKEHERLTGLGVEFQKGPTKADMGIEAVFNDTCGNFIQLFQIQA